MSRFSRSQQIPCSRINVIGFCRTCPDHRTPVMSYTCMWDTSPGKRRLLSI